MPSDSIPDAEPEMVAQISATLSALPVADFDSACSACPELSALRSQIKSGWPPSAKSVSGVLAPYYTIRDELSVKDNYVLRGSRLIAPLSLRHTLITLAHESHQGISPHKTTPAQPLLVSKNGLASTVLHRFMCTLPG